MHGHLATLNMIFSVTYYLELHGVMFFYAIEVIFFNQVQLLVFYNVQTTNLTFVDRI